MPDYEVFDCGDVVLQSGLTCRGARLAYRTYGRLNADKTNAIVYPTSYGAQHYDTEWMIGPDRALDPSRWFIVIPNMFGNGLSTSPSTLPAPFDRGRYPHFTLYDNVVLQQRLLAEHDEYVAPLGAALEPGGQRFGAPQVLDDKPGPERPEESSPVANRWKCSSAKSSIRSSFPPLVTAWLK